MLLALIRHIFWKYWWMAGLYVWLGVLFAQRWASPLVKVMAIVLLGLAVKANS